MKPHEPSRTALMIARQRAAHQVLDQGSILYDPFAVKILGEDEQHVLQFATGRTDFLTSKTSVSRRSGPGSATPLKALHPDRLVFMSSTLSTRSHKHAVL